MWYEKKKIFLRHSTYKYYNHTYSYSVIWISYCSCNYNLKHTSLHKSSQLTEKLFRCFQNCWTFVKELKKISSFCGLRYSQYFSREISAVCQKFLIFFNFVRDDKFRKTKSNIYVQSSERERVDGNKIDRCAIYLKDTRLVPC